MTVTIRNAFEVSTSDDPDVRIIIDVFRASTTALAVLEKQPQDYLIANDLEILKKLASQGYRVISEVFDLGIDNSPSQVQEKIQMGEKIVQKTANLTTALEKNYYNGPIAIACFNNLSAVAEWVRQNRFQKVEIVPAGLMEFRKETKEDSHCAEQLRAKLIENKEAASPKEILIGNIEELKSKQKWPDHYLKDLEIAVTLDVSKKIPSVTKVRTGIFKVH